MTSDRQSVLQPDVQVVTEASQLNDACDALRSAGRFAFDTEFIKEGSYEPRICVLQAATDDCVFLIDPLFAKLDAEPLWALVADPDTEVIVHAGAEDLALCHHQLGRPPARVFDVQIAAGLAGLDYPLSLARLVRSILGVRLHKSQTLSDWGRRPLSDTQLRYAVEDVAYLPSVHRFLQSRLGELSRLEWAQEEFRRLESAPLSVPGQAGLLKRIKGAGSLDAAGMAIAMELAAERDALARELNRPVRAVLRDHLLVEIARRGWATPKEILSLRGVQLNQRALARLADAVRRGQAVPPESRPTPLPPAEAVPEEAVLIALMTSVIRAHCLDNEIAFSLVTNKQDIRTAVVAHVRRESPAAAPPLMTGWRHREVGPILEAVLSGHASVRVEPESPFPKLAIVAGPDEQPGAPVQRRKRGRAGA